MKVITIPEVMPPLSEFELYIFMAGSIEMDAAEEWQTVFINRMEEVDADCDQEIVLLNPRRAAWDSSWEQSIDNPQFKQQVTMELQRIEKADIVIFYFDPNTKSPISLLELGLVAREKICVVCCPSGFWRKGNVDIVCDRYGIHVVETMDDLIAHLKIIC